MLAVFKEFREFAVKGNMVDLAVGLVIGAAFGTIVKSLVDDILMPPVGLLLGGLDFSRLMWVLKPGAENPGPYETLAMAAEAGAVTINYGQFLSNMIAFLVSAWAMFLVVKAINRLKRKQEEEPEQAPAPPEDVQLLREIRDLLKAHQS